MSKALDKFREQQKLAERLVSICESDVGGDHDALSRAGVVFCVAFWQAYVENLIREAYEVIRLKIRSSNEDEVVLLDRFFELNERLLEDRIKFFNTPNSEKVKKLFITTLKFDPVKYWDFQEMLVNETKVKGSSIQAILNFWLDVRHSIAHGARLPQDCRDGTKKNFDLNHDSLVECINFFKFLTTHTDMKLDSYLEKDFGINLQSSNWIQSY